MKRTTIWLILFLSILSGAIVLKGCLWKDNDSGPTIPQGAEAYSVEFVIHKNPAPNAKAVALKVEAIGLNDQGQPGGPIIDPIIVSSPVFPVTVPIILYRPPCHYLISVTTDLSRDPVRLQDTIVDICQGSSGGLPLGTYEELQTAGLKIQAPSSAPAGSTISVKCIAHDLSAPDRDRYPVAMNLGEQSGRALTQTMNVNISSMSAEYPDPFPLSSTQNTREFTCRVWDTHPDRHEHRTSVRVVRIPATPIPTSVPGTPTSLPGAPTSLPGVVPTPEPPVVITVLVSGTPVVVTATPTETPLPTATPTETPTPTVCQVANANDSGTGSLRQILADAVTNNCQTITFVAGLPTITLSSTLAINALLFVDLTIDGGSGVTISGGGGSFIIFWVTSEDVIFNNLTITQGSDGIRNTSGKITIGPNSEITNNNGHGISSDSGMVVVDGTVSDNTSIDGGGINSYNTVLIINGIVENNQASNNGGGIYSPNNGTLTVSGTIRGNTAGWSGGGIYSGSTTVTIESGAVISSNQASYRGGGLYCSVSAPKSFTIEPGTTISGNQAGDYGGGMYVFSDPASISISGAIDGNSATYGGGIAYNSDTNLPLYATISNNQALYGGGLHVGAAPVSLYGTISGNNATLQGGGVFVSGSSSLFEMQSGGMITGNDADSGGTGGGIYAGWSSTVTGATASNVTGNTATTCDDYYVQFNPGAGCQW